ncbi:MAG: HNH endonuclease signature motif containing protein [Candidatus Thiodiazotropha endolucinida]
MPRRPPVICSAAGCTRTTTDPSRRCENHPREHNWESDRTRGNRHERGYGNAWEKLRQEILERDHFLCQPCLRKGQTTVARQVDHIRPKADGGTDDTDNLQSICISCHKAKTARERKG